MSNFRIISNNVDITKIKKQIYDNIDDWYTIKDFKNISGKKNTVNFLPLVLGVVFDEKDNIKDSEYLKKTKFFEKYSEVISWLKSVNCYNVSRCAFLRLVVGGKVLSHIDDGKYYLTKDRYHLCIQGTYEYTVEKEVKIIRPGTFFWFDNKKVHSAVNIGNEDRISFVFDIKHSSTNP